MKKYFNARSSIFFLLPLLFALLGIAWAAPALARIEFADNVQDHMVVQRGARWEVGGTSGGNASFGVTFAGQTVRVQPKDGVWKVQFDIPSDLSGLAELIIDQGRLIKKIQVGDIWLCSGQSNMEMGVNKASDKDQITRSVQGKTIRIYQVRKPMNIPQPNAEYWMEGSSGGAGTFSALCLAFGAALHDRTRVPIGLIDATVGGTWIESWISPEAFKLASSAPEAASRFDRATKDRERRGLRKGTYGLDKPSQLFELMIAPLEQKSIQAIKGVLWYQGEGSWTMSKSYAELLSLLIKDWRQLWADPALPFVVIQLPKLGTSPVGLDMKNGWAALRDAQRVAVSSSPPAALVVSMDLGDGTFHPPAKLPFAKRAADVALELVYDKGQEHLAPVPTNVAIRNNAVWVEFDKGKACVEGTPFLAKSVFIAGEDRKWHNAEVDVARSSILAYSPEVPHPVAIRYAWSDYPVVGLQTCKGAIPVTTFRTDNWN